MQLIGKLFVFIVILLSFINTMSKSPSVNAWLNGESIDFSFGDAALVFAIIIGMFIVIFGLAIWLQKVFNITDEPHEDDETTRTSDHKDSDQTKK